jgi:hypothetical protein
MSRSPPDGLRRRANWRSSGRRAARCRRWRLKGARSRDVLGRGVVRQPRTLQRLRESAAARADLRAQRIGGRSAGRAGPRHGARERLGDVRREVTVGPVPRARWSAICKDCSGAIDSLVELLQGRFSKGVMTRLCEEKTGLFPSPKDIVFTCSCPDWASMCKHVAAVLYGIGARLDHQPEVLFTLRNVNQQDLIADAGSDLSKRGQATSRREGARERGSVGDVRHRDGAGSRSRNSGAHPERSRTACSKARTTRRFRLMPSAFARRSTDFSNGSGMCTVVDMNILTNISHGAGRHQCGLAPHPGRELFRPSPGAFEPIDDACSAWAQSEAHWAHRQRLVQ